MQPVGNTTAFGYFTLALLATAVVAFAAGIQFLLIGLRQKNDRTPLTFALLSLCVATLACARAMAYGAHAFGQAVLALRVAAGAALLAFPALMLFVASYTRRPVPRPLLAGTAVVTLVLFALNLREPGTVLYDALRPAAPLRLPWGETLYMLDGTASVAGHMFYWLSYAVFLWALYRAACQYREGQRLRGALLGACLLLQFLALLWTAVLVNALGMPYPAIDVFAFLSFVLLMALSLMGQMHAHAAQIERGANELRKEAATRRQAELDLRHAAFHDSLTGLPNRLRALGVLSELIAGAEPAGRHGSVLMIDLDNFKTINDSLGHHVGDRVLEAIADRMLAAVPDSATVARLGGDEFVVLLDATDATGEAAAARGLAVAEDLLKRLLPPLAIDSRVLAVGASIGVATFPEPGMPAADIVRRADIALYRAKAAGRQAARLFQPQMQHEVDTRLELERGLRVAVERGELAMHFQPQLDMAGQLQGAEALLRWQHPTLGEITPDVFIPIAEETGLIHALGRWAMDQACRHLCRLRRLGLDAGRHLSVNVSPWQLANPGFVEQLAAQVEGAGVLPTALTLELTESALLDDFEAARRTLQRLSELGFRLSLDDFGTGYSSLAYLQQLPLDELKIDRSFVRSLQPTTTEPLVGFIIDVGRRLGMVTVAEGVETTQQRDILAALGCDIMQGHLVAPPLDGDAFVAWLRERAAPAAGHAVAASP